MLTAIILTRGDKNLEKLKKSLSFCDEILVFKDENLLDFSAMRSKAVRLAKGDVVFFVDDDEEITDKLKDEILAPAKHWPLGVAAYAIPRRNFIFRKEMKHCGLWPDFVIRLIKKDSLLGYAGKLHEQPKLEGKLEYLKSPLIHRKHDNLTEMVDKTNIWSEVEARLMFEAGHPKMNIVRFFSAGFREFYLRMIRQVAFLDGAEGVIYGLYQVFSRLVSYSKLWELQLKNK